MQYAYVLLAQDDTPKPTSEDVYIHSTPSATFYVSQYGGYSMDDITVSKHVCLFTPDPFANPNAAACFDAPAADVIIGCLIQEHHDILGRLL